MLGHLIGLIFVCFAILLSSRVVALTDDEEELAGEIWHPVHLDYKDDPSVAWLFRYLPILTAVAATCSLARKKYEAHQTAKKSKPIDLKPVPAAVARAEAEAEAVFGHALANAG